MAEGRTTTKVKYTEVPSDFDVEFCTMSLEKNKELIWNNLKINEALLNILLKNKIISEEQVLAAKSNGPKEIYDLIRHGADPFEKSRYDSFLDGLQRSDNDGLAAIIQRTVDSYAYQLMHYKEHGYLSKNPPRQGRKIELRLQKDPIIDEEVRKTVLDSIKSDSGRLGEFLREYGFFVEDVLNVMPGSGICCLLVPYRLDRMASFDRDQGEFQDELEDHLKEVFPDNWEVRISQEEPTFEIFQLIKKSDSVEQIIALATPVADEEYIGDKKKTGLSVPSNLMIDDDKWLYDKIKVKIVGNDMLQTFGTGLGFSLDDVSYYRETQGNTRAAAAQILHDFDEGSPDKYCKYVTLIETMRRLGLNVTIEKLSLEKLRDAAETPT